SSSAASDVYNIQPQEHIDEPELKPAPKIFKEDCRIDWNWNGKRIVDFIRGLSPYPAAWSPMFRNGEVTNTAKIFAARFHDSLPVAAPGTVCTDWHEELSVACADGWIRIGEIQLAGKRRMSVHDLLLGFRDIDTYRFE
ncbi:MAG: methionyl-tRNA formyltransferase, partial [Alistipes sp.]|nr:methionyl-tRNA formyltransferase [Alistipes sp.]